MSFTKVETRNRASLPFEGDKIITIKPFFEKGKQNMGLEDSEMVIHDGVYHTEQLACLELNGIKRYVTGLNEFAPEIKRIKDLEVKKAKIIAIRTIVARLEENMAANTIDIDDVDFWKKVVIMSPNNSELWNKIELKAGNETVYLDPVANDFDLITICAIEAGGFDMCAKSYEDALSMAKPKKFFLDRNESTVAVKNVHRKLKNKALSTLQILSDSDTTKMLYILKSLEIGSAQFKKSTPSDIIYGLLDDYINGKGSEKTVKQAAIKFNEEAEVTSGELRLKCILKDASYYKYVFGTADGHIKHKSSGILLGRNMAEALEFIKDPVNEDILDTMVTDVEIEWNK